MNSKDLKSLIDYIMKNNSWKKCSALMKNRKMPKYIDFTLDTRDGDIWFIEFRNGLIKTPFRIENKKDLKSVYKWLDEVSNE